MVDVTDRIGLKAWIQDLTYKEIHAATFGVMHGLGIVAGYLLGMLGVSIGLVTTAFCLLGWTRTSRTKDVPYVSTILATIPAAIRGQIRDEQHYYGGALILTVVFSVVIVTFAL
jgi:hypothetical protein